MKAAVYTQYGDHTELKVTEHPSPVIKPTQVLIDVHATSVNGSDWEFLTGKPAYARVAGLRKPEKPILGSDISGVVSKVGSEVKRFKVGDAVFGDNFEAQGGFAEQVAVDEKLLIAKPDSLSHIIASSIPQSGVIAMQGLNNFSELQAGQRILLNGAGGSGGGYAIQLAKKAGAYVVAVDHENKRPFISEMGADEFIDYSQTDVTACAEYQASVGQPFDKILDFVGHHSIAEYRKILTSNGHYTIVGGKTREILAAALKGVFVRLTSKQKIGLLIHKQNQKDMKWILNLLLNKELQPCVGSVYCLDDIGEAFRQFGLQQTAGKVVIKIR